MLLNLDLSAILSLTIFQHDVMICLKKNIHLIILFYNKILRHQSAFFKIKKMTRVVICYAIVDIFC